MPFDILETIAQPINDAVEAYAAELVAEATAALDAEIVVLLARIAELEAGGGGGDPPVPVTDVFTATLTADASGDHGYSHRPTVKVTDMADAPYLVVVLDFAGSHGALRYANGLGTIDGSGGAGLGYAPATASYNSAAELGAGVNGQVSSINRIQIRGSGAGREIRARFEAAAGDVTIVSNAAIGKWAGTNSFTTPNRGSTTAVPVELKFAGASGFSISSGATIESDWMPFPVN